MLLPTSAGEFTARAFECPSGAIHLALVSGELGDGDRVLTRVHSECVTGDALGSLRCDCGIQLRTALRAITAEGRGVLIYATGHEGRGIGLLNKLRAYALQDDGLDTLEANVHLGFPPDARDYTETAACLAALGIRSLRLLTNNPHKVDSLRSAGLAIDDVVRLPTSAHVRNRAYLETKELRMQHTTPAGEGLSEGLPQVPDLSALLGTVSTTRRAAIRCSQIRTDARRPHRNPHGRLEMDQQRGRATHFARPARGMRRRPCRCWNRPVR